MFRLKRRLEQYEHDRQVERVQANRLQAKREAEIEARLRKERVCITMRLLESIHLSILRSYSDAEKFIKIIPKGLGE